MGDGLEKVYGETRGHVCQASEFNQSYPNQSTRRTDFLVLGFKPAGRPAALNNVRNDRHGENSSPSAPARKCIYVDQAFIGAIISLRIHRRPIVKSAIQLSNYRGNYVPEISLAALNGQVRLEG